MSFCGPPTNNQQEYKTKYGEFDNFSFYILNLKPKQYAMNRRNFAEIRSVGNYTLDGVSLGKGTFSRVERATHAILKRPVALKIQLKESIDNKGSSAMDFQTFRLKDSELSNSLSENLKKL